MSARLRARVVPDRSHIKQLFTRQDAHDAVRIEQVHTLELAHAPIRERTEVGVSCKPLVTVRLCEVHVQSPLQIADVLAFVTFAQRPWHRHPLRVAVSRSSG
ncbi:MAG TPA: hypothetical protein VFF19_07085 [Reyranella sp.]|nr:hypothetical protein [Reyranella sp.]